MKKQKMKQITGLTIILTLIFTLHTSCTYAYKGVRGDGNVVKQERKISSFSGIEVGGAFKVFLTQGESESLTVEADENLMDIISTEVHGKTLKINTTKDIQDSKVLNVYITFKMIDELDVSGACQLSSENKFKLGDLNLDCSGASDVTLKMSATDIELDCSGASQVDLFGTGEFLSLDLSGASNLDASDFEVGTCDADVSGASHGKIMVRSELSAEVSGAGSLKYSGDPVIKSHEVSGAGSLKKL